MSVTRTALIATAASFAALATTAAADASAAVAYGHTPSGNITCRAQSSGGNWSLVCTASDPGRTVRIATNGDAYKASYQPVAKRGTRFSYGSSYSIGPFVCTSDRAGLSCYSDRYSGNGGGGFFLSRETSRVY